MCGSSEIITNALAFSRSVSYAANVGIGKIAVAETLAKKCRLFMWCLMLAE